RDIGMGTSKVKLGARVAVIGGGNTAIDCAREALRQGAEEVTMITVEGNPSEMPCVPEDLHDMREEGVELMHSLAMTAGVGNGKRVAFNVDKVLRAEPLQERMVAIDVITDLNRMNMTYFPKFPRVQQSMLAPASRRRTQEEVILAYTEEQATEEAARCFSC